MRVDVHRWVEFCSCDDVAAMLLLSIKETKKNSKGMQQTELKISMEGVRLKI